ncbi:MAG: ECF transporter S component [Clostridia bacterium]|nr:ECF transporter S component [Clostridia bacterium]
MSTQTNSEKIRQITFMGMMSALILVLQQLAVLTRSLFPFFSITLVLVPIVLGSAISGKIWGGAWLGGVFGVAVFLSGDANGFLAIHQSGTIITVMAKGILCGVAAALVYRLMSKKSRTLGVFSAAIVCPVVNTGVFLLGCLLFFYNTVGAGAAAEGTSWFNHFITGYVGVNFIVELAINIVLAPVILQLISIAGKNKRNI